MEPRHGACYDDILALALATERAGFDAFFRSDHLLGVDPKDATYRPSDCWTTLAGLARDTGRVRLGALATGADTGRPTAGRRSPLRSLARCLAERCDVPFTCMFMTFTTWTTSR